MGGMIFVINLNLFALIYCIKRLTKHSKKNKATLTYIILKEMWPHFMQFIIYVNSYI